MRLRLRNTVITLLTLCLAAGFAIAWAVIARWIHPQAILPALWLLIVGGILLIGTVFETIRYKPVLTVPPAGWTQTSERFIDEHTQQTVEVFINPETGERAYVRCS